jgi:hypothetical protein
MNSDSPTAQMRSRCMLCRLTMQKIFISILILIWLISCKGQDPFVRDRLKIAHKFLDCLKNNTPDKILSYAYPEVDNKINDKEARDFYVGKAYEFIKKFGLPSEDKWIIKYDPKNNFERLLITIPIFKGYDSTFNLLKANIVIYFPPPQISDKIYRYDIEDEYDMEKETPTLAPESVDTTKKN